jgi:hypothetical protein
MEACKDKSFTQKPVLLNSRKNPTCEAFALEKILKELSNQLNEHK